MISLIALDLEGTLISNAMSQIPRPGLYSFLDECSLLAERVVMFTTVREERFRPIANLLVEEGYAPEWFRDIEYVKWEGKVKDLTFIPRAKVQQSLLVDDFHIYVAPGQENRWIEIKQFEYPYSEDDNDLSRVLNLIKERS